MIDSIPPLSFAYRVADSRARSAGAAGSCKCAIRSVEPDPPAIEMPMIVSILPLSIATPRAASRTGAYPYSRAEKVRAREGAQSGVRRPTVGGRGSPSATKRIGIFTVVGLPSDVASNCASFTDRVRHAIVAGSRPALSVTSAAVTSPFGATRAEMTTLPESAGFDFEPAW